MSIRGAVLLDVHAERGRQYELHPQTCREMARAGAAGACLAVLMEEVGEVARALNDNESTDRLRAELVQVAAVAVAWVEGLLLTACTDTPDRRFDREAVLQAMNAAAQAPSDWAVALRAGREEAARITRQGEEPHP